MQLVTVIMPYYKKIHYVDNAINSIVQQTYKNYEIYNTISHVINPKNLISSLNKKKQSNNFYASLKKTNLTFKWKPRISILKGILQMINEK